MPNCRFVQLTDLHLSDRSDTPTHAALLWAVKHINRLAPDFVMASGDLTTFGSAPSARLVIAALEAISAPVFFTPGNAEHRSPGAMPVFAALNQISRRAHTVHNTQFLFPDTSQARLHLDERAWMADQLSPAKETVIITHYPIDTLDKDSQAWILKIIASRRIPLYVAGHKHIHRTRILGACTEIITRGLDPDKASGHLPGISLFEQGETWTETFIPFPFDVSLLPCAVPQSPVGWSIQGDPIAAICETQNTDLHVLELRPKDLNFPHAHLKAECQALQNDRPLYLSWHLPNLSWDATTCTVAGQSEVSAHLSIAQRIDVNHLTVHVPQLPAHLMQNADIWSRFEQAYDTLFRWAVASGIRLSIENIHNAPGVRPADPDCKFATDIDDYLRWIAAVRQGFANIPNARVGAHFDVGHARNNGELGNIQPLADWYACLGKEILGYHIHQIGTDPRTGKTANHKEMHTLFDLRISYAGFLHAWSTQKINRAPLFVEIRDPNQRRRTTQRLQHLFQQANQIQTSLDLPVQ